MKEFENTKTARRQFVFRTIPACALTCMFSAKIFSNSPKEDDAKVHMFDKEFPKKLTYRKYVEVMNLQFIELAKGVQKRFGDEETFEIIKGISRDFNLERGRKQAENSPDRSLKTYTRMFADLDRWDGVLKMEVVEDTEKAFELKVSDCIQAECFNKHDASDLGYAQVCLGDYAWAEGFNPKIKLVRDKTLMQGHSCCNHRYVWTG